MLDSNIVIYLDIAGLLPACGKIVDLGLARVAIPGEVKKELGVKGTPKGLTSWRQTGWFMWRKSLHWTLMITAGEAKTTQSQ